MGFQQPVPEGRTDQVPRQRRLGRARREDGPRSAATSLPTRFLDFSIDRDGVVCELHWAEFRARNRAVAARLQQVTEPGDRVAILARRASTTSSPSSARSTRAASRCRCSTRTSPVTSIVCTPSSATARRRRSSRPPTRPRVFAGSSAAAAAERPRIIAVDAIPDRSVRAWRRDIASTTSRTCSTPPVRPASRGVEITHRAAGTNVVQMVEAPDGEENAAASRGCRCSTTWAFATVLRRWSAATSPS